jgi:hypothetical protein
MYGKRRGSGLVNDCVAASETMTAGSGSGCVVGEVFQRQAWILQSSRKSNLENVEEYGVGTLASQKKTLFLFHEGMCFPCLLLCCASSCRWRLLPASCFKMNRRGLEIMTFGSFPLIFFGGDVRIPPFFRRKFIINLQSLLIIVQHST